VGYYIIYEFHSDLVNLLWMKLTFSCVVLLKNSLYVFLKITSISILIASIIIGIKNVANTRLPEYLLSSSDWIYAIEMNNYFL